jgi:hypothetical protein
MHPFEKPREMTCSLNAMKLERMSEGSLIGSLQDHSVRVDTMRKDYRNSKSFASGSVDGEIGRWDSSFKRVLGLGKILVVCFKIQMLPFPSGVDHHCHRDIFEIMKGTFSLYLLFSFLRFFV